MSHNNSNNNNNHIDDHGGARGGGSGRVGCGAVGNDDGGAGSEPGTAMGAGMEGIDTKNTDKTMHNNCAMLVQPHVVEGSLERALQVLYSPSF